MTASGSGGSRLRRWLDLRRYLRASRPQLVVSFLSYFSVLTAVRGSGVGARVVFNQQTPMSAFLTDADYPWRGPWHRRAFSVVTRVGYSLADAIVATSAGIADRKQPEVALIHFGTHVDVFGMRLDEITSSLVDEILELYPRIGMKAAFTEALTEVVTRKPHTVIGTGLADIGHRHVHGFCCPNLCDMIDHAPFES